MDSKKKVLFTATVDSHILHFHIPFLKLFKDNNYETHVATNGEEKIPYCDFKHTVCFERKPIRFNNLKAIKELKTIINKEKFDIIHTHTPMGAVVTRIAAKKSRKKYHTRVIYTAHGFHFYKGAPLLNWLVYFPVEWYLAKYTDTLITINKEDYERAKKRFSKRCKDIQYVPGVGIDTKKFEIHMTDEEKKEYKKSLGLSEDDFVLTCVARLDKNKNQILLINVVEDLLKKHDNIHLLLVGQDELDGFYQRVVNERRLNNNIHFLGRRDDIPKILVITNIIASASKREGLPVNILEAATKRIPVIALKCRGIDSIIENNFNGYIVDNKIGFMKRIDELITNKEEYTRLKKNRSSRINEFTIENTTTLMKHIYSLN